MYTCIELKSIDVWLIMTKGDYKAAKPFSIGPMFGHGSHLAKLRHYVLFFGA